MPAMSSVQKHPKSGVWRIRRAIPETARFAFGGKREYLKSLGTKNFKEAQSKAYPILAEVQRRIDKASAGVLYETDQETCSAAYAFIEWDGENGGAGFIPFDPSPYIFDDREHFLNRLNEYCVECGIPTGGNAFDELENIVESEVDHLYAPSATQQTEKPTSTQSPSTPQDNLDEITELVTLSQLCERLFEYKPNYIGKTESDARRAYKEMIELHGDLLLTNVKKAHVREYRDILLSLPVKGRTNKVKAMPLRKVAGMDWEHTVSRDTVMKQLGFISQGFVIAVSEGWAVENPREGLIIPIKPTSKSVVRREFRPPELETAFTSHLFNKCGGSGKEAKAGKVEIRDYRYWLPLVALYTGARLAELCQLEKTNLRQDGEIWYLEITEVSDDDDADEKSLKTEGSMRNVPVHHVLIEKGFIAYAQAGTKPHIFTSRYATQRKLSHEYSKWFGRYLDKIGLVAREIVYHSFRHNFITACRSANIIKEVRENFTGHKPQDVSGKYGSHDRLMDYLKEEIDRVEYEGID
jgi:integrase